MIRITPAAAAQIADSASQSGLQDFALRLEVIVRNDGSFHYVMGFDDTGVMDGSRVSSAGIELIVAPGSEEHAQDLTIDYVQLDSGEFAFVFLNPRDPHYTALDQPGVE